MRNCSSEIVQWIVLRFQRDVDKLENKKCLKSQEYIGCTIICLFFYNKKPRCHKISELSPTKMCCMSCTIKLKLVWSKQFTVIKTCRGLITIYMILHVQQSLWKSSCNQKACEKLSKLNFHLYHKFRFHRLQKKSLQIKISSPNHRKMTAKIAKV